jgi:excisionase family DNA binding protein
MQDDLERKNILTGQKDGQALLTIGDASEYLGISIDTLRRWEKKGRIEPLRSPGGHRYYKKEDLDGLFGKRYVREEETIRTSSTYNAKPSVDPSKPIEVSEPTTDSSFNTGRVEDNSNNYPPQVSAPISNPDAVKDEQSVRAYNPHPEFHGHPIESPRTTSFAEERPETFTNFPFLERPTREVKIPEVQNVQVVKEDIVLSSQEAYFRQQSFSVLTPPEIENSPAPDLTTNNDSTPRQPETLIPVSNSVPTHSADNTVKSPQEKNITIDKNLLIYGGIGIGILMLLLAWYAIYISSQRVLSPVP